MDPSTEVGTALWAMLAKLLPGAAGAVIQLLFVEKDLNRRQMAIALAAGVAIAYFMGPLIVSMAGITGSGKQQSIGFLIGLFGLKLTKEAFRLINSGAVTEWIKRRFLPGERS